MRKQLNSFAQCSSHASATAAWSSRTE